MGPAAWILGQVGDAPPRVARPGSVLSIPVATRAGRIAHKGLLSDELGPDGLPRVIHRKKFREGAVVDDTMTGYCEHALGLVSCDGYPGELDPAEVLRRARALIGERWKLSNNCEHFIRCAHGLPPLSPQLRQASGRAFVNVGTFGLCAFVLVRLARLARFG